MLRVGRQEDWVSIPSGGRDFSLRPRKPEQPTRSLCPLFGGVKRPWHKTQHLHPSSTKTKNEQCQSGAIPSLHHRLYGVKRITFTFYTYFLFMAL